MNSRQDQDLTNGHCLFGILLIGTPLLSTDDDHHHQIGDRISRFFFRFLECPAMAAEAEMEFGSMKRKELQALCKKHGIPANKTNRELALLLTIALKVNEAPVRRSQDEGEDLDEEENDTEVPRKRVRFSPEVETREYEPTACKQKGRTTRASAKVKKANPCVHVDEASKNLEKDEPGNVGRRRKRNAPKGTDSEPMLVTESKSSGVSGRITRRAARSQSTCNTSAVNEEEDHCDVIDAGESLDRAKRYPSRRQCVVIQTDKFGTAELELKGKTSKRSSKGELESDMDAQASADAKDDKTEKALAPAGNLRRSRQKTVVLGTTNIELGSNTNAEASKEDVIEKVSAPVANLRKSRRKGVVLGANNLANEVGDSKSVVVEEIPTLVIESKSSEVRGRITRLRSRSQSTCNNSAVKKEDHNEVPIEGECPVGAEGYPSRRQCLVTQTDKFESAEQELKGKTSKRSRKGELEVNVSAQASADAEVDTTEKASAPAENLRRSKRKTDVSDTSNIELRAINPVDEAGDDKSVVVEEIPKHVNRKSTRQKFGVLKEDKSKGAQEKLRGKAFPSNVSSNSKLEVFMVDEASVVDNLSKVSSPVVNLRRSRRNTNLDEVQKSEAFRLEESAKAVVRNFSGLSETDAKELKRKADTLLRNSGLEVIMEIEPSATSKENIKAQKAPLPTGNLRRSRRKTSVLSPICEDNAVGTIEAVGSLCQIGEQVSGNDVEPTNESRHTSNETGFTTDVVGEIDRQSCKGKRARLGTQVVKRESVVGKLRQSARVNLKSSKAGSPGFRKTAEKEQHTTIKLPVTAKEANKSAENVIPVEESPTKVVEIGQSESVPDKGSVDTGEKIEGTPSLSFSKLVGSSRHQGLPRSYAHSEKNHTEVKEEVNVGFVSVLSKEKLDLLHSSGEGGCLVSPERNKSSERSENLKEISGGLSFKLVGGLMDEEIAGSSRNPASMRHEAIPSGDDCDQWARDIAIEGDKDEQLGRNLEMSEELNHGNLGEPEQPTIESRAADVDDLSSENQLPLVGEFSSPLAFKEAKGREELHGNEDQPIVSNKNPIPGYEFTEPEVPQNQEDTTFDQKFSQAGQELFIKNAANVFETDKNNDFSFEDDMNKKGGNSRRLKLEKLQTEMMSPKAATGSTARITGAFDTHKPQFSIDDLETGIAQNLGALDVQENEATVEDKLERNYPASEVTGGPSLILQNVSASPSSNGIEIFQLPWEVDSSKLTDIDNCPKTTESMELPDGSSKKGQTEMQELEIVEVPLDGTDCCDGNPPSIENGWNCSDVEAAKGEDCSHTIGEEVEGSGKEDNPPGSSSYCYEQFLENQGSTLPSDNLNIIDARQSSMVKALDGVLEQLAKEEAETTSADLSCCKDPTVSKNDGSEANSIRVLCQESAPSVGERVHLMVDRLIDMNVLNQEKSMSETEEDDSGQKESTNVFRAEEYQDFCGDDEMNEKGRSSRILKSDKVENGRTWVPGSTFSECSRDSPVEINETDQTTCVQEISNQANEAALASQKDNNDLEVPQFSGLADVERLTNIEILDVYEGVSKEVEKELQAATANEEDSSLEVTQELVINRLSIENSCNYEAVEETKVLDKSSGLSSTGASFHEETESMGLNLLFEGQDGEANQVTTSISEQNASSSPGIAVREHNNERMTKDQQEGDMVDDASIMSSPFCIPLANSFAPLCFDISPGTATMEVDKLPPSSLSSPPQNASSNHAGKDGAAINDKTSLPSPRTGGTDDASITSSPFCIPLANSFAPLCFDMSPRSATMEVDNLSPSSLSSPQQKSSSNHAGKDGAAIDDEKNLLPSPQTGRVEDDRGEDKQEKTPWSLELELLGSPKVPRTSPVPGAASGSGMKGKLASPSSSPPAFRTRKKPAVVRRTTGKIFVQDMKENAGRSKLDVLRQQLGNVTAPSKSLVPGGATRRRPLQELATRRKD
ncbi:unnamed protein product [Linum tenue]|uniref:SAP domain-containing protein n=1 Tax=Linum tenue TaxID=586396 RepID=A0AAV0IGP9_9ROSI|nr:unnamed protein product [Linum tenue]